MVSKNAKYMQAKIKLCEAPQARISTKTDVAKVLGIQIIYREGVVMEHRHYNSTIRIFLNTICIVVFPLLLISCGTTAAKATIKSAPAYEKMVAAKPNFSTIKRLINVPYGPLSAERLDLCLPTEKAQQHPGVLLIHGGGWTQGSSQGLDAYCIFLAQHGFVVGNMNYRLAETGQPATQWPAQLIDAQLAVRWMRWQAASLNLDPQHLCAWGTSAGGQLAVFLAALKRIQPGAEAQLLSDQAPTVSCVIDAYGPVDLTQPLPGIPSITTLFGGATLTSQPLLYRDASPIFALTSETAPILIVQGTQDTTVPPSQSQVLLRTLQRYKVPVQYISYKGGHSFHGLTYQQIMNLNLQILTYLIQKDEVPV
jgi:acetyl esterase/lipase